MKRENLWKLLFFSLFLAWNAIYLSGIYVCVYWSVCRSLWFESLRFQTRTTLFQKKNEKENCNFFGVWLHEKKISHIIFIYIRFGDGTICTVHAQSFHSHTHPNESRIVAIAFKWFWHHESTGKLIVSMEKCILLANSLTGQNIRKTSSIKTRTIGIRFQWIESRLKCRFIVFSAR